MSLLDRARILADIAKIGSEIYGLLVDKSRALSEKNQKIKDLEMQIAELKKKAGIS